MAKKIKLSPEQDTAANPSENVWVQANAGTGKTSVLVQRLLRILYRTKDLNNCGILCLTYTKAAAGEMLNRILTELQNWAMLSDDELTELLSGVAEKDTITKEDIAHARAVFFTYIDNPDLLKIKTIHGFCEEILRKFPMEAGLSPSWSLISDEDQHVLLQETFSKLINSSNDARVKEAFAHIVGVIDETKLDALLSVLSERYKDFFQINDFNKYRQYFIDKTRNSLNLNQPVQTEISEQKLKKIISSASEEINNSKKPAKYLSNIVNITEQYINKTINFEKYKELYLNQDGTIKQPVSKKAYLKEEQDRVYMINQYNLSKSVFDDTLAVFDLSVAFANIYKEMKRRRNVLDFEDMILYTRKLFASPDVMGWVLSQLNTNLTHVLVDEAQDNSPAQWDILQLLTGDFFTEGDSKEKTHSLFVVGDTKQSIYGFQGADPKAFDNSRIEISEQIQENMRRIQEVPLVQSFRSAPQILYTVDKVFNDDEIKEKTGFINNTHKWVKSGDDAFVEIHKIFNSKQDDVTADSYINEIADQISNILKEGKFSPSDIMVLVQNREPMTPLMVNALKKRNIPVAGSDRICLPNFPAIRDLLNLVRFCINTEDDYSLCCVLKSPIFRLSEQDIFNLCKIKNEENKRRKNATTAFVAKTVFEVAQENMPDVFNRLSEYVDWASNKGPYSFFTDVLNQNDIRKNIVSALGEQVIDPIEEFITICLAYERTQTGTMYHFLKWFITGGSVIKRDMDSSSGVRVVTVHGSKGLEAPIIFLIDTVRMPKRESIFHASDKAAKEPSMPTPWLWAPRRTDSISQNNIEDKANKTKIAEYYRLLYVAMTRAAKRLYIYGFVQKNKSAADLCWYNQLWRVISNDERAIKSEEFIRIEDVK